MPDSEPIASTTPSAGMPAEAPGERGLDRLLARPLEPDALAAQTSAAAQPLASAERATGRVLVVRLGRERLAFDVVRCRRVVPVAPAHRVPHRSNDVFAGLCAVDGELMPAIRIDRLLGVEREAGGASRMVVLADDRGSWAIEVDEVEGVRSLGADAERPPPDTVAKASDGLSRALADLDGGEPIAILDAARLFARFERSLA